MSTEACLFVVGELRGSHNVILWNRMMMGIIGALGVSGPILDSTQLSDESQPITSNESKVFS